MAATTLSYDYRLSNDEWNNTYENEDNDLFILSRDSYGKLYSEIRFTKVMGVYMAV